MKCILVKLRKIRERKSIKNYKGKAANNKLGTPHKIGSSFFQQKLQATGSDIMYFKG